MEKLVKKIVFISALLLTLTACPPIKRGPSLHTKTTKVETQFQLGQVNMTMSKPVPWYQVKKDYKPNFGVKSAKELLDDVAPITGGTFSGRSVRTAVRAELEAQGISVNNTSTATSNSDTAADGQITSTSSSETKRIESRKTPGIPEDRASAPSGTIQFDKPDRSDKFDPFTKYRAATAVYQRIRALDTYLDTEYNTDQHAAFLVHAQITPIAFSINQPYDVLTTIEFFESEVVNSLGKRVKSNLNPTEYRIFPLIAIDNPERIGSERRSQQAQEFLGRIGASSGAASGALSIERVLELLDVTYGDDLNSLQSVSQNDEKDLFIRLGAGFDPDSNYEIRNRPVDVSFVVTLDRASVNNVKGKDFRTYMSSRFINVFTGHELPKYNDKDVKTLTNLYQKHAKCESGDISKSKAKADLNGFLNGEDSLCWVADIGAYRRIKDGRRRLIHDGHLITFGPLSKDPPILQNVVFSDDKKNLKAEIVTRRNSDITLLRSRLLVNPTSTKHSSINAKNLAESVFLSRSIEHSGELSTLTFPSLRALGIDVQQSSLALLVSFEDEPDKAVQYPMIYKAEANTKKTRTPSFEISKITDRFQGDEKTNLTALMTIKPKKAFAKDIDKFVIKFDGVVLKSVTGLSKQNTPVALSQPSLDITTSSFSFKPGSEAIYKIELDKKGPQSLPLLVSVQALDDKGKLIQAESRNLLFK